MATAVLPISQATKRSSSKWTDAGIALLCGLATVMAVLVTNPVSESPFNDDWSYSFTVRQLVKPGTLKLNHWAQESAWEREFHKPTEGKLTYNGWASASLIAQAYWGLAWVKLFGFSYTVLRLSTLPLAAFAVSLCYLLAKRVGLNTRFAVFSTLLLGLSPLYLPVANSFMTDAPGLFFTMLSMYALAGALDSTGTAKVITWVVVGALVGLIGGTGRQIVWVVPLVFLPYLAWIRRDNTLIVVCALAAWSLVLGGAMFSLHWFNTQPYAIPEAPLKTELKKAWAQKAHFLFNVFAIPLTAIWVILPAMWGVVLRGWKENRAIVAFLILVGPVLAVTIHRPKYAVAPWMGNTLSAQGVMGGAEIAGDRPFVLPVPVRIFIGVVVFSVACILLADLLIWLTRPLKGFDWLWKFFLFPQSGRALLPAMILFAAAYFTLLLPRCASNMAYDRYLLPLMPCMLFPLLLRYQFDGDWRIPRTSWILLGLYALFAIGITQEVTALERARAKAVNVLIDKNIPRPLIDAGFEFDYETQLFETGYINDPRIKNPKGAYKQVGGAEATYIVQSKYRLETGPAPDTKLTDFGHVDYTTYLYPFHRRIYIDEFKDPWWLDEEKVKTHPADKWHSVITPDLAGQDEK